MAKRKEKKEEPKVCVSCGEPIKDDDGYTDDGEPICEGCYDSDLEEPCATVLYGSGEEDRRLIGCYQNETDGDFTAKYNRTDGWRGYYEVVPSEEWAEVFTDALLSGHSSEKMIGNIYDEMLETFDKTGIEFARVFARSSNVFFTNMQIFVKKKFFLQAKLIVLSLQKKYDYDNPKWNRGILFDEHTFDTLAVTLETLGHPVKTDGDILNLVEKDDTIIEKVLTQLSHPATEEDE